MTDKLVNEQIETIDEERRTALNSGSRIAMAAGILGAMGLSGLANASEKKDSKYAEPAQYANA